MKSQSKVVSQKSATDKVYRYCAYQERSHQEVRNKLYDMGLRTDEVEELLTRLITEGFLNEERFARAFAGGKFRMKGWGRIRIVHALEAKGVSPNCIKSGLKEINDEDYLGRLREILQKKIEAIPEPNAFVRRDKVARHAIQKGFEPDMVWRETRAMLPDGKG